MSLSSLHWWNWRCLTPWGFYAKVLYNYHFRCLDGGPRLKDLSGFYKLLKLEREISGNWNLLFRFWKPPCYAPLDKFTLLVSKIILCHAANLSTSALLCLIFTPWPVFPSAVTPFSSVFFLMHCSLENGNLHLTKQIAKQGTKLTRSHFPLLLPPCCSASLLLCSLDTTPSLL